MQKRRLIFRGFEISLVLLTLLLALVGFGRILPTLLRVPDSYDFAAYYVAGRTLNVSGNVYDAAQMAQAANRPGDAVAFPRYIYPPFFAALMRPFASFSFATAKTLWFILNAGLLIAAIALLARMAGMRWWITLIFGGVVMLMPPIYDTFLLGQVNFVLLFLLTLMICFSTRSSPNRVTDMLAGVLLGIAAVIKIYPLLLGSVYLLHRRWNVLVGVMIGIGLTLVVGVLGSGNTAMTVEYFTVVAPNLSGGGPGITDQSIWPVIARLFSVNQYRYAYLTPTNLVDLTLNPVVNAPWLGTAITILLALLILGVTARTFIRSRAAGTPLDVWFDLSIGITLIMLLFPVVHDHYFTLLLIPFAYIFSRYRTFLASHWLFRIGLTSAILGLVLQRYWRVILNSIPSPLVLISGFTGALILWLVLLWLARTSTSLPSETQG